MKEITEEEFNHDPKRWQEAALDEPVIIVENGTPKLYLLSRPVFDSLYKGSRRAISMSELDDKAKKALLEARVSPEHDHLNTLLEDDSEE